jgi:DNA-binding NtrC family response regulator
MKMARMVAARPAEAALPAEPASVLEQVTKAKHHAEREVILSALDATRWNRKQAAALLKVDYKALLYKMKKLGIDGSKQGTAAIGEPRALEANYTAGV